MNRLQLENYFVNITCQRVQFYYRLAFQVSCGSCMNNLHLVVSGNCLKKIVKLIKYLRTWSYDTSAARSRILSKLIMFQMECRIAQCCSLSIQYQSWRWQIEIEHGLSYTLWLRNILQRCVFKRIMYTMLQTTNFICVRVEHVLFCHSFITIGLTYFKSATWV